MPSLRESISVIKQTLERSEKLDDELSYLIREPDSEGRDSNVSVPVMVLQDNSTSRDDPSNDNIVGYLTNDNDERVGKVYETKWQMELQIDIWTAAGSDYNVDKLGQTLHEVLYDYDVRGPDKTFVDDDGESYDLIYDFTLQDGSRNDNLDQTPSVRRWRQLARVRGAEEYISTADQPPVRNVTQ